MKQSNSILWENWLFSLLIMLSLCLQTTYTRSQSDLPSDTTLALVDVTILQGVEPIRQDHMTVLIEGGRIQKVGKTSEMSIPVQSRQMHLSGKYLIPGLIDGHVHIRSFPDVQFEYALKWGITSIRCMGDNAAYIKLLQKDWKSHRTITPDLYFSAMVIGNSYYENNRSRVMQMYSNEYELGESPWLRILKDTIAYEDTASWEAWIESAKQFGATGIKTYSHITSEQLNSLVQTAHRAGLKVWSHPHLVYTDTKRIAQAGVDLITHALTFLLPVDWDLKENGYTFRLEYLHSGRIDSILTLVKSKGILLEPTLVIGLQEFSRRNVDSSIVQASLEVLKRALGLGIPFVAGTDLPLPQRLGDKPILFNELQSFVTLLGITTAEALASATIYNARSIGMEMELGSIEQGKIADMIVLKKNPLDSIEYLSEIDLVIKRGSIVR